MAERIAAALVMAGLAACVQVSGPLESRYVWNGVHERSTEWLCTVKSRGDRFDELRRAIEEIHPYETPEIIAIPVCSVSERYAAWIDAATSGRG